MIFLVGNTVTNGGTAGLNLLQRRGWNFTISTTGVADTLYFKANATTTYKFGVYAISTISAAPTTLLASTIDVVAIAGNTYSVPLSTSISLTSGQFLNISAKVLAGGAHFQANSAVTANCRFATSNDASFSTPMADPFGTQSGSTTNTPAIWLESTIVSITALDKLETGSVSTITLNDAGFAATNVKITSDTITKTASTAGTAPTFTFTPPVWIDSETALKYGAASVVANNGSTDTSAYTAMALTLQSPYSCVDLTSVSANSIDKIAGFSPAYKIGSQIVYDATKGTVYADGAWDDLIFNGTDWVSSGFTGTTQIWDRDPDDKIARSGYITVSGGAVVIGGGLTSSGLTSSGLTRAGLTSSGL